MDKKRLLLVIAYVNVAFFWGTNNLATRIGVSNMAPFQFAGLRFLIAGILLAFISRWVQRDRTEFSKKEYKSMFVLGTLMFFMTNGCVVYANKYLDSGIVTILLSTIPIFATLIDLCMNRDKKLGKKTIFGLLIGFLGVIIVTFRGDSNVEISTIGIVLSFMAALFWSFGSTYSKYVKIGGSIMKQNGVEALFASVLLLGSAVATGGFSLETITPSSMMPILYLAVFDSIIGFVSYTYLLRVLPMAKASTYAYINPLVALVVGYLVLQEPLTATKICGMAVILVGVVLIQQDKPNQVKLKK